MVCWFALKFSQIVQYSEIHKKNVSYFVLLIGCYGNRKNGVLFVTMATINQVEKSSIQFPQNNKLINLTKFQAKLITLSWDKMLHSASLVAVARGIAHSYRGKNFWKLPNCYFLLYSIMLHKNLFHAMINCWVLILLPYLVNLGQEPP